MERYRHSTLTTTTAGGSDGLERELLEPRLRVAAALTNAMAHD
jgi:hypothetical protein